MVQNSRKYHVHFTKKHPAVWCGIAIGLTTRTGSAGHRVRLNPSCLSGIIKYYHYTAE